MKEHKTGRHRDTITGSSGRNLTSEQEFKAAKTLADLGTVVLDGDVSFRWEKPLACVIFPDGYQFTVFEYDEAIGNKEPSVSARHELKNAIIDSREDYEEEYLKTLALIQEIQQTRSDLLEEAQYAQAKDEAYAFRGKEGAKYFLETVHAEPLSFEVFARLKADMLFVKAKNLYVEFMYRKGFGESPDNSQVIEQFNAGPPAMPLLVGYDLEYVPVLERPLTPQEIAARKWIYPESLNPWRMASNPGQMVDGVKTTAALYAMAVLEGKPLPPVPNEKTE